METGGYVGGQTSSADSRSRRNLAAPQTLRQIVGNATIAPTGAGQFNVFRDVVNHSRGLLVAKGFYRVQIGCLPGWIDTKQ